MVDFIDKHRVEYGAQPICKVLPIALSTYYAWKEIERDYEKMPERRKRDEVLSKEIRRVWNGNFQVYGARKVWRQLQREGHHVARCTVERLMAGMGLYGAIRGKRYTVTTQSDESLERPRDLVQRNFDKYRPNQLWVADITYACTCRFRQLDHVLQVSAHLLRRQTTQAVISAQLNHQQLGLMRSQQTRQALQTTSGGLPTHRGIMNFDTGALGLQALLKQRYPTIPLVYSIGCADTIAQHQH